MRNDGRDPDTLIGLIFRIVDVPRRTLAVAALAALLLAALSLARLPFAELGRGWTLWGGGACIAGLDCLRRRVVTARRRDGSDDPAAHSAERRGSAPPAHSCTAGAGRAGRDPGRLPRATRRPTPRRGR
jgi:hypothetical protein